MKKIDYFVLLCDRRIFRWSITIEGNREKIELGKIKIQILKNFNERKNDNQCYCNFKV